MDKLKEMGELNNTYIVYTADHGIAIGRHGFTWLKTHMSICLSIKKQEK